MRKLSLAALCAAGAIAAAGQAVSATVVAETTVPLSLAVIKGGPGDLDLILGPQPLAVVAQLTVSDGDTLDWKLDFSAPLSVSGLTRIVASGLSNFQTQVGGASLNFLDAGGQTIFTAPESFSGIWGGITAAFTPDTLVGAPTTFSGLEFLVPISIVGGGSGLTDRVGVNLQAAGFSSSGLPLPEPATWAMLILGFFGLGSALRRQKGQTGAVV